MTAISYILSFGFVLAAVGLNYVQAATDAEFLNDKVIPVLTECAKEHGTTTEEVIAAKKNGKYDEINPCVSACVFKKDGTINDKGMFDPEQAEAKGKEYVDNDDDLTKLKAVITSCTSVNQKEVSDGEKGCERAQLLIKCFMENHQALMA